MTFFVRMTLFTFFPASAGEESLERADGVTCFHVIIFVRLLHGNLKSSRLRSSRCHRICRTLSSLVSDQHRRCDMLLDAGAQLFCEPLLEGCARRSDSCEFGKGRLELRSSHRDERVLREALEGDRLRLALQSRELRLKTSNLGFGLLLLFGRSFANCNRSSR